MKTVEFCLCNKCHTPIVSPANVDAWLVVSYRGPTIGVYRTQWEAQAIANVCGAAQVEPLYRAPKLTHEECEVLNWAAHELRWHNWASVIRGLLTRAGVTNE